MLVPRSSRSSSGYRWITWDAKAKKSPWRIRHPSLRTGSYTTIEDALVHLNDFLRNQSDDPDAVENGAKKKSKTKATVPASRPPADAVEWMHKPHVRFQANKCNLFGCRIQMRRKHKSDMEMAVIKAYVPAGERFVVVFDTSPSNPYEFDLFAKSTPEWSVVEWEGPIFETDDLRPVCPQCGIALGEGASAWTRCHGCGECEPGVNSVRMLNRTRAFDPYRRPRPDYCELFDS